MTNLSSADTDRQVRLAAFEQLVRLAAIHGGALPWTVVDQGFESVIGHTCFASAAEGIFKPAKMSGLLSIKTVVPKPKGRVWYADQVHPDEQVHSAAEVLNYAFKGRDSNDSRNQWLRLAMEQGLPIVYFYGVAPAVYEPIFPAFVVEWEAASLTCGIAATPSAALNVDLSPPSVPERRYAMRLVKQRLHQSMFRERVVDAYGRRCALTGFPEVSLVDAAHIVPDRDVDLGQPDIRNGICMSKVHHAAFDGNLIGIDADLKLHVARRLLVQHDGPMLEQVKALHGARMRPPDDPKLWPDRDRLVSRFEEFKRVA
jgi:putative restriction endonuclease